MKSYIIRESVEQNSLPYILKDQHKIFLCYEFPYAFFVFLKSQSELTFENITYIQYKRTAGKYYE